jgi:transcriptional regulator with XRE-family HTH domain
MVDSATSIDSAIGAAIRAARFSRGLTQSDLAAHLGVTRATVASYETGRRKIPAETLIQIARLCGKPLGFFEPADQSQIAELAEAYPVPAEALPAEAPALQALTNALQLRPDAIPLVMEFLEAWLSDQAAHADREPLEGRDEA